MSKLIALLVVCGAVTFTSPLGAEDAAPQFPSRKAAIPTVNAASLVGEIDDRDEVAALPQETAKPESSNKQTPKEPPKKPSAPATPAPSKTAPVPAPRPALPEAPPPVSEQLRPFANNQQFAANNRPYIGRLARTPDMFGDSFIPTTIQLDSKIMGSRPITANLPVAMGSGFKNEYGRGLPTDRVFGFYHYFADALQTQGTGPGSSANKSISRFTLGFEKTFFDGNASVEIRMPFTSQVTLATPGIGYTSDGIGNLVVNLKHLLYRDDDQALALGLAVSAPTGSGLQVVQPGFGGAGATIDLSNDAVHLVPYLAYQATPDESWFFNGFVQVDTPTNGNTVRVQQFGNTETLKVTDQTLLYLDAVVGYWWWQNDDADFMTGLASVFEVHYTSALNNASSVATRNQSVSFGNTANHFNVVNVTFGLNAAIARNTQLRAACVLPLRDGTNRFFDSEFTVGLIYRR